MSSDEDFSLEKLKSFKKRGGLKREMLEQSSFGGSSVTQENDTPYIIEEDSPYSDLSFSLGKRRFGNFKKKKNNEKNIKDTSALRKFLRVNETQEQLQVVKKKLEVNDGSLDGNDDMIDEGEEKFNEKKIGKKRKFTKIEDPEIETERDNKRVKRE